MTRQIKIEKILLAFFVTVLIFASLVPVETFGAVTPATVQIPVEKQLQITGSSPTSPQLFNFMLETINSAPMPADNTVSIQGAGIAHFAKIEYSKPGIYEYKVSEVSGNAPNYTYDKTIYNVYVIVQNVWGNDGNVSLNASMHVNKEGETEKLDGIIFSNKYRGIQYGGDETPANLQIEAKKKLDGEIPDDNSFTFQLKDINGQILQTKNNQSGQISFDPIKYSKVGSYIYTITEVEGDDNNIKYDDTVYTVIVEVSKVGNYYTQVTYLRDGKSFSGIPEFYNKTKPDEPTPIPDESTPLDEGDIPLDDEPTPLVDINFDDGPKLPQTGLPLTPVVLMASVGMALVIIGTRMRKKINEEE